MKTITAGELARMLDGEIAPASAAIEISGVGSAADAQPGQITFLGNRKYLPKIASSQASVVLVPRDFDADIPAAALRVDNPSAAFAKVVAHFAPATPKPHPGVDPSAWIHPAAKVDPSATIGHNAVIEREAEVGAGTVIGANCFVGYESRIGDDCLIHPNVSIRERALVGCRVIIHCGAVIGSDGYGFEFENGRHRKIPQVGIVQIDDDVEIGANTTIDRARFGRTWIQEGVKIDNLVQIAHNVVVGRHSLLVAQTGIAGSTTLGQYVTLAGQVGVVGHVDIGEQTIAGAKSGIAGSLPAGSKVFGYPCAPMAEAKRQFVALRQLPRKLTELRELRGRLDELENQLRNSPRL